MSQDAPGALQYLLARRFLYLYTVLFALAVMVPVILYGLTWNAAWRSSPRIVGAWDVTLQLTKPYRASDWPVRAHTVHGSLQVRIDSARVRNVGMYTAMDFAGRTQIDLGPFGFERPGRMGQYSYGLSAPRVHDSNSFVVGRMITKDSVLLVVQPFASHGFVRLRGAVGNNRIAGVWRFITDDDYAEGTFVLERRSRP